MVESFKRFNAPLNVQYDAKASDILDKDYWRVTQSFRYYLHDKHSKAWVDVPAGYLMDGASVPRPFWSIVPPWGQYGQAAAVHDWLCEYLTVMTPEGPKRITRKRCDEILNEAMEVLGVDDFTRGLMYNAVATYRIISGTDEPQLNQTKLLLEAAWRERNPQATQGDVITEPGSKDGAQDAEVNALLAEDDVLPEADVAQLRKDIGEVVTKEWIIRDKTAVEAGYVDNPDDPGGATNCGITEAVARLHEAALRRLFSWDGDMRNLTKEMAFYIYDIDYWKKMSLDDFYEYDPMLADKLFDIAINCGVQRCSLWVQRFINVCNNKQRLYPDIAADGIIGPGTMKGFDNYVAKRGRLSVPRFLKAMLCKQGAHYQDISFAREQLETFTYGWLGRLDHNFEMYYERLWDE